MISLNLVRFSYPAPGGGVEVLRDLSATFPGSEISVIVGPSGCGKTTLLNLVAGLLTPTAGEIDRVGEGPSGGRSGIGYVFQTPALVPWRTVWSNALLGADIRRLRNPETERRAEELLTAYGLRDYRRSYPGRLSSGMQQRVSIIRAVVSGASVLLLDEPFANSDALMRRQLHDDLLRLVTRERLTALLVTHDLAEAVLLGDRVFVLGRRPARVVETIEIPIPRERRAGDLWDRAEEMKPYYDRLRDRFRRPEPGHEADFEGGA